MRIRQPGISPEKIAIAVAVTMAAMAGIGAMKNVTGTSNAVAMVAVSPGTAPTNRPKSEARTMTRRLYGSNTSTNACIQASLIAIPRGGPRSPREPLQQAPWQRHPEHFVKAVMNDQRDHQRQRKDPSRPDAEDGEQRRKINRPGRNEPEQVDQKDVENIDTDDQHEREDVPRRAHPWLGAYPWRFADAAAASSKPGEDQDKRAGSQGDRDEPRKQRRADFLPGYVGKALDVNENGHAEQQQQRTPDGVVDFHAKSAAGIAPRRARNGNPLPAVIPAHFGD